MASRARSQLRVAVICALVPGSLLLSPPIPVDAANARHPGITISDIAPESSTLDESKTYLFANPQVPVYGLAGGLAVGDFNQDGRLDMVTSASVLLGFGDGTFGPELMLDAGIGFTDLEVGDLDRDGRLDLALLSPYSATVVVLLGRGDGTFHHGATLATGGQPSSISGGSISVGDLEGDGDLDLVTANFDSNDISVFLNRGDGSFAASERLAVCDRPSDVALGDLDRNGLQDLVVTEYHNTDDPGHVEVLLGQAGGFIRGVSLDAGEQPNSVTLGDWDGDAHLDLAVANIESRDLNLYFGVGDGSFTRDRRIPLGGLLLALRVASTDLDGDGTLDLLVVNPCGPVSGPGCDHGPSDNRILYGRGDGTFQVPHVIWSGAMSTAVAIGDVNGDQRLDVMFASDGVSVLLRHSDGGYDYTHESAPDATSVSSGDVNGDGQPDLATLSPSSGELSILLNRGTAGFDHTSLDVGVGSEFMVLDDLNVDGNLDIVVLNPAAAVVSSFLGQGDGSFTSGSQVGSGTAPMDVAVGHVDSDDWPDLVLAAGTAGIRVLFGLGGGAFSSALDIATVVPADLLSLGDFNEDGHMDVVVGGKYTGLILMLGRGDGGFVDSPGWQPRLSFTSMIGGDFNGDGTDDVCVLEIGASLYRVFLGDRESPFSIKVDTSVPEGLGSLVVVDLNADGMLDIAALDRIGRSHSTRVSLGRGDGGFTAIAQYYATIDPRAMAAGDFDGEGRQDLAVLSASRLTFLLNQGAYPDQPPVADARQSFSVECASPTGSPVTLDGSASSDPDSSLGTNDDIVDFEWTWGSGSAANALIGKGEILDVNLPLGTHEITLRVHDRRGQEATARIRVSVVDTKAPTLSFDAVPAVLWPPNHELVPVQATWRVWDQCDASPSIRLLSVTSSEPDDAPGPDDGRTTGDIARPHSGGLNDLILLRSERSGMGPGRSYEISYVATDSSGNQTLARTKVFVPHDRSTSEARP